MPTSFTQLIYRLVCLMRQAVTQVQVLAQRKDVPGSVRAARNAQRDGDAQEELSKRKRVERRLSVQYAVSRVLLESAHLDDAAPQLLQAIGEGLGWELGMLWRVDHQATLLHCCTVWG